MHFNDTVNWPEFTWNEEQLMVYAVFYRLYAIYSWACTIGVPCAHFFFAIQTKIPMRPRNVLVWTSSLGNFVFVSVDRPFFKGNQDTFTIGLDFGTQVIRLICNLMHRRFGFKLETDWERMFTCGFTSSISLWFCCSFAVFHAYTITMRIELARSISWSHFEVARVQRNRFCLFYWLIY